MHAMLANRAYNILFLTKSEWLMHQQTHVISQILRFLLAGAYVLICLFFLALLIAAITGKDNRPTDAEYGTDSYLSTDGSNAVSSGLAAALNQAGNAAASVRSIYTHGSYNFVSSVSHAGTAITHAASVVTLGTYHGIAYVVRGVGHGLWYGVRGIGYGLVYTGVAIGRASMFIITLPVNMVSSVSDSPAVGAVIRPADHDPVPVIDPSSPELAQAKAALSTAPPAAPAAAATPPAPVAIWPIHGMITTQFGEPEPPYQPIHTGIDISDGKRAGITPIKAFRAGRVIDVEHTGGLGNHVVIDHGSGVTSVYGHLNSISVSVGQVVDTSTTVGFEGTTGVSTGPHLHFEIRVNGQATDPHQFIPGQPY